MSRRGHEPPTPDPMKILHLFRSSRPEEAAATTGHASGESATRTRAKTSAAERGNLYRFKRDVLMIVARLNRGVPHQDCEVLKRQTIFVQTQLFHSIYNDPAVPAKVKEVLMNYHLKSIKATIGDRRAAKTRAGSGEDGEV